MTYSPAFVHIHQLHATGDSIQTTHLLFEWIHFFNLYFNLKINEETFQVDSLPHMIQNPIQILINSLEIETKFWILKTLSDIHLINENNYCKYSGRIMCATYSASKRLNSSQVPVCCLVDWMLTYQWSTWPMISDHSLLGKYINGFRM